ARADGLAAPEGAQLLQQRRRPRRHERALAAARLLAHDARTFTGRLCFRRRSRAGGDAMRLRDKVAVVTGSASGFGRTTAARLAEEGARVLVVDLDAWGGAETVTRVRGTASDADLVVTDVSSMEGAEHAMSTAEDRWGGVDI